MTEIVFGSCVNIMHNDKRRGKKFHTLRFSMSMCPLNIRALILFLCAHSLASAMKCWLECNKLNEKKKDDKSQKAKGDENREKLFFFAVEIKFCLYENCGEDAM